MTGEGGAHVRRLLVESPAPRVDVARGFAVTGDSGELLRRFAEEPHTEAVDLGEHAHGLRVLRWRLDPAVAEVAAPDVVAIDGAASQTPAGSYLLDSRTAEVLLRFRDRGQRLELSLRRGHVALFSLELLAEDLPAFEPLVATGGAALEEWLAEHLEALRASDRGVATVAAAGALLRFFGPLEDDDPALGPPTVVRGVRAWARSVEENAWPALTAAASEQVAELIVRLDADVADALELAHRRDMLESVAVVASLVGRGAALRARLDELDERATHELTRLTESTPTTDDPRLRAVAWSEPEAWWGTLAR